MNNYEDVLAQPGPSPRTPEGTSIPPEVMRIAERLYACRQAEALSTDDPYFSGMDRRKKRDDRLRVEKFRNTIHTNDVEYEHDTEHDRALKTMSGAFEYAVYKRINEDGWLGDHMRAQLATEHDDRINGIDIYIEDITAPPGAPVGFSVDVTFAKDFRILSGKIDGIKRKLLDTGRLAQLDYYKPLGGGQSVQEKDAPAVLLPKLIVGVDSQKVRDVLAGVDVGAAGGHDTGTGLIMLRQMELQLLAYRNYSRILAESKGIPKSTIQKYETVLEQVRSFKKNKLESLNMDPERVKAFTDVDPITGLLQKIIPERLGFSHDELFSI